MDLEIAKLNYAQDSSGGAHLAVRASSRSLHVEKHVTSAYWCCPCLANFDWIWRCCAYWDSSSSFVSWATAAGVLFGSICFGIAAFASVTPAIYKQEITGNCMGDLTDWLQGFVYLVGDAFWLSAVSLQLVEALNIGYEDKLQQWEASGCYGSKPRYHWLGIRPGKLQWWGALAYLLGILGFTLGDCSNLVNDCPNTYFNILEFLWLISYANVIGGVLIAVAGALYVMGETSVWLLPGIFCPCGRGQGGLKWWGLAAYFWAGILFGISGLQNYWWNSIRDDETEQSANIITGLGFGGGAILFVFGAALLLARQARGRCRAPGGRVGRLGGAGCFQTRPQFCHDPSSYAAEVDKL